MHVAICNWRDLRHSEGGGSELYVETVAARLAAAGHRVTLLCARVPGAPADEVRSGVRYRRRGSHHTVYLAAAWALLSRQVRPDAIVDVHNGVPYLSRLVSRRPVVALVHHVHREQWSMVFGPRAARIGWWVESRLGPWIYRTSPYIAVSEATRRDLVGLGVEPERISIVHNGTPHLPGPRVARSATPRIVVLGRLVPHKQVEIVLAAIPALRERHPGLVVDIVGQGWHDAALKEHAAALGVTDAVAFHGYVDDQTKADLLARAWLNAVPSVKEGWALSVVEAASVGTPSVAFAAAGGLRESIVDGRTGVLVDGGAAELARALSDLLDDPARRDQMGAAAREHAAAFTWEAAAQGLEGVLSTALGRTTIVLDAVPEPAVSIAV
ncbi:MAG TPA: glycosyltransferase family 4 protein [Mycobacteriales bacterium]|nr:glycosyltransferase family 4 protein [Mycobacteriales bacterium]